MKYFFKLLCTYRLAKPLFLGVLMAFAALLPARAQSEFQKGNPHDNSYKKGVNREYYKSGKIKSVSHYKRKVYWYYTDTYWTIREYDMEGNEVRRIKKVTQTARRENHERVLKEKIREVKPKNKSSRKETIRSTE
jgi:hypothetical protein